MWQRMGDPVVIGMDVATATGIAVGEPGAAPVCWTEVLGKRGSSHAERFGRLNRVTSDLIARYNPVLIAIERPIMVPKRDNLAKLELLYGLVGCIRGVASNRGVATMIVNIDKVDRYFLGMSKLKSADRKRAIMTRCLQLGYKPDGQDSADACAVWSYACSTFSRSHSIATTPLFQD